MHNRFECADYILTIFWCSVQKLTFKVYSVKSGTVMQDIFTFKYSTRYEFQNDTHLVYIVFIFRYLCFFIYASIENSNVGST